MSAELVRVEHPPSQNVRQALEEARENRDRVTNELAQLQARGDQGEDVASDLIVARERVGIAERRIAVLEPQARDEALAEERAVWQAQWAVNEAAVQEADEDMQRAAVTVTEAVRALAAAVGRRNEAAGRNRDLGPAPAEFVEDGGVRRQSVRMAHPAAAEADLDAVVAVALLAGLPGGPQRSAFRAEMASTANRAPLAGSIARPRSTGEPFAAPASSFDGVGAVITR